VGTEPAELAERLDGIAEELAELALDRLRGAASALRDGGSPDPRLAAEEKRITRARRAVEKAAGLLAERPDTDDGP
jgi:hypothetical protein